MTCGRGSTWCPTEPVRAAVRRGHLNHGSYRTIRPTSSTATWPSGSPIAQPVTPSMWSSDPSPVEHAQAVDAVHGLPSSRSSRTFRAAAGASTATATGSSRSCGTRSRSSGPSSTRNGWSGNTSATRTGCERRPRRASSAARDRPDRHGSGVVRPGFDGAGQPARRSRSIRSSIGGWVMNSRISPRRVPPEMPRAAIWSGKGSRP